MDPATDPAAGPTSGAASAREATHRLLADARRVGRLVHDLGEVSAPLPVHHPAGVVEAWFVPVVVGDRIVGFALIDVPATPAGVRRWSTFQRHEGDVASCPASRLWTDPGTIAANARSAVGASADAGTSEPVLTWERSPEHLVWEVVVDGRTVHVAGASAWPA